MTTVQRDFNEINKSLDKTALTADKTLATADKTLATADKTLLAVDKLVKTVENTSVDVKEHIKIINKICQEIRDSSTSMNKTISSYIKNEADLIEDEINKYIKKYLTNDPQFHSYNIFNLTKIWKYLRIPEISNIKPDPFINKTDNPITEFDGLYILTDNFEYYPADSESLIIRKTKNNSTNSIRKFVVVEAKHSITGDDINKKIKQMIIFQEYLKKAKKLENANYTKEFIKKVQGLQLNEFSEEIILIFASDDMDESRTIQIHDNYLIWVEKKIYVSYLRPGGDRYELYSYENENKIFIQNRYIYGNVRATSLTLTAGRKKNKKVK